jgi:hypothetical protein
MVEIWAPIVIKLYSRFIGTLQLPSCIRGRMVWRQAYRMHRRDSASYANRLINKALQQTGTFAASPQPN